MQALFYGSAVIYPLAMVLEQSQKLGTVLLFNPIAQAIQDTRHVLVSEANPTLYSLTGSVWLSLIPVVFVVLVVIFGAWYFKRKSPYFAEEV